MGSNNQQLELFAHNEDLYLANLDKRIAIGNLLLSKQEEFNLVINELGQLNANHSGGYSRRDEYDRDKKPIVEKLFKIQNEANELIKQFNEVFNELTSIK